MDQSVKIRRILVQLQKRRVLKLLFTGWVLTQDQLHTLGEALLGQLQFNTYQVELILNKSFVNLKQKVVTIQQAEPLNPSETGLGLLLELLLLLKLTKLILALHILLLILRQRHLVHVYACVQRHGLTLRYHAVQDVALPDPREPLKSWVVRTSHWRRIHLRLILLLLKNLQSYSRIYAIGRCQRLCLESEWQLFLFRPLTVNVSLLLVLLK